MAVEVASLEIKDDLPQPSTKLFDPSLETKFAKPLQSNFIEDDTTTYLSEMKLKDEACDSVINTSNQPPIKDSERLSSDNDENASSNEEDYSSDDESSDEESSDEEEIRAPIELIGEFIQYIRGAQWEKAKKLCSMILIYEPQNAEALQFKPLIEERLQMAEESDDSDEDSSSDEYDSEEEEEDYKESDREEEEGELSSDDDDEEEDHKEHILNPLIFQHKDTDDGKVWKP